MTLLDGIDHWARQHPERIAFRFLRSDESIGEEVTCAAVRQRSLAVGRALAADVPAGSRALLLFDPEPGFIDGFLGCLAARVIAVPADPPHGRRAWSGIEHLIADCRPSVILTTRTLRQRWDTPLRRLCAGHACRIVTVEDCLAAEDDHVPLAPVERAGVAFLQYTSGSTSQPKGVMVTHANIMANLRMIQDGFEVGPDAQVVSWLPLFHDMGLIGCVLAPLHAGCTSTILSPTAFLEKPVRWLRAITRYRGTHSSGPNFSYDLCRTKIRPEDRSGLDLSTWRCALNGSEPVSARTLRAFQAAFADCGFQPDAFRPCYGMAEATLLVSNVEPRRAVRYLSATDAVSPSTSSPTEPPTIDDDVMAAAAFRIESADVVGCGRARAETTIRIVDPATGVERPDTHVGEIWVQGPHVAAGYWGNADATAASFGAHLAGAETDGRYLRTGDLGCLDDGELFIMGRLKELLIIRGRNVVPQDIEDIVTQAHGAIRGGHVAAVGLVRGGAQELAIVAEIERAHWRAVDPEAVVDAVLEAVQAELGLAVASVTLLRPGAMPKTTSGKLKRLECARRLADAIADDGRDRTFDGEWEVLHEWRMPAPDDRRVAHASSERTLVPDGSIEGFDRRALTDVVLLWLRTRLAQTVDCSPEDVADEEPFARFGLDSAVAVTLTGELAEWLGLDLGPTIFWEHPHPAALAEHLADLIAARSRASDPVGLS